MERDYRRTSNMKKSALNKPFIKAIKERLLFNQNNMHIYQLYHYRAGHMDRLIRYVNESHITAGIIDRATAEYLISYIEYVRDYISPAQTFDNIREMDKEVSNK